MKKMYADKFEMEEKVLKFYIYNCTSVCKLDIPELIEDNLLQKLWSGYFDFDKLVELFEMRDIMDWFFISVVVSTLVKDFKDDFKRYCKENHYDYDKIYDEYIKK